MEKEERKQMLRDYKIVNNFINQRLFDKKENSIIVTDHYLSPIIVPGISVGINDGYGELKYFKEIRDCLEEILIHEKTSIIISHPPEYVQKFIERKGNS